LGKILKCEEKSYKLLRRKNMDQKNIKSMVPSTSEINASTPGVLAFERFKIAQTIQEDTKEAQELKNALLENDSY
jgi:hypothetical protein